MLLDLTRYPLVMLPDECTSTVALRTISAQGVSGTVWYEDLRPAQGYRMRAKEKKYELPPTASFPRGLATYHETRLPVEDAKEIAPFACVFEAASVLGHSLVKEPLAAWRVRVSVLWKTENHTWHVTAWDLSRNDAPIMCIVTKAINPFIKGYKEEATPLMRAKKTLGAEMVDGPANAWTRLLEDD